MKSVKKKMLRIRLYMKRCRYFGNDQNDQLDWMIIFQLLCKAFTEKRVCLSADVNQLIIPDKRKKKKFYIKKVFDKPKKDSKGIWLGFKIGSWKESEGKCARKWKTHPILLWQLIQSNSRLDLCRPVFDMLSPYKKNTKIIPGSGPPTGFQVD